MRWSKKKQLLENKICQSLNGRIKYYITRYNAAHDDEGKAWITFDGKEILNFSRLKWAVERNKILKNNPELSERISRINPNEEPLYEPDDKVSEMLSMNNIFHIMEFTYATDEYLQLSIENALKSDKPIIKALALIDNRLGKRKLKEIIINETEHDLVKLFYTIRIDSEKNSA